MKNKISILPAFILSALLLLASCRKFDYYQVNPNSPSEASPALLLTDICVTTFSYWMPDVAYASRHMTYYERPNVYINYGWGAGSFAAYDVLRQVTQMDALAQKSGETNYQALAKFFRAVHFSRLTETFGDVPYSEAMQALSGNRKPKYDTQETIYAGVLQELEEANNMVNTAGSVTGDIIYNGDMLKWKKLINTYRLRILIHLSKKENNTRLNIAQTFQKIISDPAKYPLFSSNSDNAQLVFNKSAINNSYPLFQNLSLPSLAALEKGFATILKDREDPRLFRMFEPVTGKPANVFSSYDGVDAGLTVATQQSVSKDASKLARRYIQDQVNEPLIFLGYAEKEFLLAEAIVRNWITGAGTAEAHYNNGITASMKFYAVSDAEIAAYLQQPRVKWDATKGIEQIIVQKYIASFLNSGWEPFFEQRRTGFPSFAVGPGTINGGVVPKRWIYPQSEYIYNKENLEAAVRRQFSGSDDVNGQLWVLQ